MPAKKKRATKAVVKKAAPKKKAPAPKKKAPAPKKKAPAPKKKAPAPKKKAPAPKKKAAPKKGPAKKKLAESGTNATRSRIQRKEPRPKQKNNQSIQNIKRIDSDKTHGWQVHVCRNGVLKTKLFSDRIHGGKRKALNEAKSFRDMLRTELTN